MKNLILYTLLISCIAQMNAQTFNEEILAYREAFKKEMLEDERAPLEQDDFQFLRWFIPNDSFKVKCQFTRLTNQEPIDVPTSSGRIKSFQDVGVLTFVLMNTVCTLHVYQNNTLAHLPELQDHLFLPFTDPTNGVESYGGGRYIDLSRQALNEDVIWIDFNLAYNPWCAYSDGYNCPIPPRENSLTVPIYVGERMYTGPHKSREH